MLARREHSRRELSEKLERKGCPGLLVAEVVRELEAERLLSDERFTEALVRARTQRGVGPLRIEKELQEKGVAEALIAQWLDTVSNEWSEIINRVRHKRFGEALPESQHERARQARFLQQRGFTFEQIRRAFRADDWD